MLMPPNLSLGAMYYFYLVQSFPDYRFVMVDSQMSLVPTVIWAHFLLRLTVVVAFDGVSDNLQISFYGEL